MTNRLECGNLEMFAASWEHLNMRFHIKGKYAANVRRRLNRIQPGHLATLSFRQKCPHPRERMRKPIKAVKRVVNNLALSRFSLSLCSSLTTQVCWGTFSVNAQCFWPPLVHQCLQLLKYPPFYSSTKQHLPKKLPKKVHPIEIQFGRFQIKGLPIQLAPQMVNGFASGGHVTRSDKDRAGFD